MVRLTPPHQVNPTTGLQFAVVAFNTWAQVQCYFNQSTSITEVIDCIDKTVYFPGLTNTAEYVTTHFDFIQLSWLLCWVTMFLQCTRCNPEWGSDTFKRRSSLEPGFCDPCHWWIVSKTAWTKIECSDCFARYILGILRGQGPQFRWRKKFVMKCKVERTQPL